MDAPDDPVVTPLVMATYGSKRARDRASDAKAGRNRELEQLAARDREMKAQEGMGDAVAAERRREKAKALLAGGRAGTVRTTPLGVQADGVAGPKYRIGA